MRNHSFFTCFFCLHGYGAVYIRKYVSSTYKCNWTYTALRRFVSSAYMFTDMHSNLDTIRPRDKETARQSTSSCSSKDINTQRDGHTRGFEKFVHTFHITYWKHSYFFPYLMRIARIFGRTIIRTIWKCSRFSLKKWRHLSLTFVSTYMRNGQAGSLFVQFQNVHESLRLMAS